MILDYHINHPIWLSTILQLYVGYIHLIKCKLYFFNILFLLMINFRFFLFTFLFQLYVNKLRMN